MRFERACGRKFSQLVPHHVFADENWDKFFAVVDRQGVAYEIWRDGGPPGPGFDDFPVLRTVHLFNFLGQIPINERTFF